VLVEDELGEAGASGDARRVLVRGAPLLAVLVERRANTGGAGAESSENLAMWPFKGGVERRDATGVMR
jgi:hypothetical protein